MKRILFVVAILAFLSMSCGKADPGCQPQSPSIERDEMVAFCTANTITYTEDPSGILYQILDAGTGAAPTATSTISFVYTLKSMNGTTLQANSNPMSSPLSGLIDGWKIILPKIKKGGRVLMVIPSALAYSCTGSGPIPPNSPIFFDVTLSDVQ